MFQLCIFDATLLWIWLSSTHFPPLMEFCGNKFQTMGDISIIYFWQRFLRYSPWIKYAKSKYQGHFHRKIKVKTCFLNWNKFLEIRVKTKRVMAVLSKRVCTISAAKTAAKVVFLPAPPPLALWSSLHRWGLKARII